MIAYLILNLFYFVFVRINADPYSINNYVQKDPIYAENFELVSPLKNIELIPNYRFVTVIDDKIETKFGVQEINSNKSTTITAENNKDYIEKLNNNIKHIQTLKENLKFKRNQEIASTWLEYFNAIKREVEFKVKDTAQIKEMKLKHNKTYKIENFTLSNYYGDIHVDDIISNQISLKWYHNSILNNHHKTTIPSKISSEVNTFLGQILDYVVGELILKEGEPKPYTDKFIKLE